MKEEIKEIKKDIKAIKENHLSSIYARLIKLETKQKMVIALLLIILGVLLTK